MTDHPYTEDQLVEQPAIGLFAALGWQAVSALEESFTPSPPAPLMGQLAIRLPGAECRGLFWIFACAGVTKEGAGMTNGTFFGRLCGIE